MKALHHTIRRSILGIVDFFYPLFRRLMPLQTFRYAACGGGNTLLNIFLFFIFHNFLFQKTNVDIGFYVLKPYSASLALAFLITFPIGFYLSMFVVFPGATLRRRIQLIRYFLVVIGSIVLNYVFLKLFVEVFEWYPTPSYMLTVVFVITFSYFTQRHYSFSQKKTSVK